MVAQQSERIEKNITLRAPRSRGWRALTTASEFSQWFGGKNLGEFRPGAKIAGNVTTQGYEHVPLRFDIERIEPETYFSYRWHPYAIDPNVDYSGEPTTLVEFHLADAPGGGTALRVVESGFENIPAARRAEALKMNDAGWGHQVENIARHVAA